MANPGSRASKLAVATATAATLRNRLHTLEQEVTLPLRHQIAELEREKAALTTRVTRAEGRVTELASLCEAYQDFVDAFIRLAAERQLASGKETT